MEEREGQRFLLVDGNVLTDAAEFTLEAYPRGVEGTRLDRIEWSTALWVGVVVIILDAA